jgi:hypothetical protein
MRVVKAANPAKVSDPGASASSRAAPGRGKKGRKVLGGVRGGEEEGDEERIWKRGEVC